MKMPPWHNKPADSATTASAQQHMTRAPFAHDTFDVFVDPYIRYAYSEPGGDEPTWCAHIEFDEIGSRGCWWLLVPFNDVQSVHASWHHCPVCGTPRPALCEKK